MITLVNAPDTQYFIAYQVQIRQQALRSYGHRLHDDKLDLEAARAVCLAFLPHLTQIIKESSNVSLKKTAVVCIDRTAELFGKKDVAAIIASARVVVGDECLGSSENSLKIISMSCLATIVEVSGHGFVSILTLAVPKAIENLATSIGEATRDSALHNAVYSFLGALILYEPWMVSGADLDCILKFSFESANAELGEDCDRSRIGILRLVSKRVEAKDCFAALVRTWTDAMTAGPLVSLRKHLQFWLRILRWRQAIKEHLEILRLTIDHQPKSIISQHSETLCDLFLQMFDFRRIHLSSHADDDLDLAEIGSVEDIVNETAISMTYKLNDATFRPIFSRILEWTAFSISKDIKARIHRQITWYNFLLRFFGTFKVCSQVRLKSAAAECGTNSLSSRTTLPSS